MINKNAGKDIVSCKYLQGCTRYAASDKNSIPIGYDTLNNILKNDL